MGGELKNPVSGESTIRSDGLVYIDQNIIGYVKDKTISLPSGPDCIWVYSNEHLSEIERANGDPDLFNVLQELKARRLELILDGNSQTTGRARLNYIRDLQLVYKDYIETKARYQTNFEFEAVQAFTFGNTGSLDPEQYAKAFKQGVSSLLDKVSDEQRKEFEAQIDLTAEQLAVSLNKASEQIKPIEKMRRLVGATDFARLKVTDGQIIDQIWNIIEPTLNKMSPVPLTHFHTLDPTPNRPSPASPSVTPPSELLIQSCLKDRD